MTMGDGDKVTTLQNVCARRSVIPHAVPFAFTTQSKLFAKDMNAEWGYDVHPFCSGKMLRMTILLRGKVHEMPSRDDGSFTLQSLFN